jgi:hypothetical protein
MLLLQPKIYIVIEKKKEKEIKIKPNQSKNKF